MSFRIDDILSKTNNKSMIGLSANKIINKNDVNCVENSNKIRRKSDTEKYVTEKMLRFRNVEEENRDIVQNFLECDTNFLRETLLSKHLKNDDCNNNHHSTLNLNRSFPQDLSKKSDGVKMINNMPGYNESTSAFKRVQEYNNIGKDFNDSNIIRSSRSMYSTSASYGSHGSHMDQDLLDATSQSHHHWAMFPSFYTYPMHPHMASYAPYLPPNILRAYQLPPSLGLALPYTKRKGGQVRFTPQQTQNLERRFGSHQYLSPEDRKILADQLNLTDRQVKTWFQNRRAKWRRSKNTNSSDSRDEPYQSDDDLSIGSQNDSVF